MKNKLFKYFCARMAFFAALSLLLQAFSVGVDGQIRRAKENSNQPEAVFTNSNAITINDGLDFGVPASPPAVPYPSTINVSGLTGTIPSTPGSIKVTINGFTHTFPDDISMVLVGPTGAALLLQSGAGDGTDANNLTYSISDAGAAQLPESGALSAGTFKPAGYYSGDDFPAPGPGTNYGHPGPSGGGTSTFASVFGGTNPNGDWKLFVGDFAPGDTGSISGGWTLEINTGGGTPQVFDNRLDYFGNGFSDWAIVYANAAGNYIWQIARNDNPTPVDGRILETPFGLATTDIPTAFGDYNGDGISDITVWREPTGQYWTLPSGNGQPPGGGGPATVFTWGKADDLVGFEGDYDGDNKMDLTVLRGEGGLYRWFILRSGTNTFSTFVYGVIGSEESPFYDVPLPGADYTGDGSDDPAVARINQTTGDILWVIGTTTGGFINKVQWGKITTDYVVPAGDYDGDGKADFAVWRGFGTSPAVNGEWLILKSTGGFTSTQFGIPGGGSTTNPDRDLALRSGDYDNDNKTDIAVWRRSNGTFYVLRSSDGQLMQQHWGCPNAQCLPVAHFNVF